MVTAVSHRADDCSCWPPTLVWHLQSNIQVGKAIGNVFALFMKSIWRGSQRKFIWRGWKFCNQCEPFALFYCNFNCDASIRMLKSRATAEQGRRRAALGLRESFYRISDRITRCIEDQLNDRNETHTPPEGIGRNATSCAPCILRLATFASICVCKLVWVCVRWSLQKSKIYLSFK